MNKRIFEALLRRHLLDWMPDATFLKLAYKSRMGKKLNLQNPQTFNEKLWRTDSCRGCDLGAK